MICSPLSWAEVCYDPLPTVLGWSLLWSTPLCLGLKFVMIRSPSVLGWSLLWSAPLCLGLKFVMISSPLSWAEVCYDTLPIVLGWSLLWYAPFCLGLKKDLTPSRNGEDEDGQRANFDQSMSHGWDWVKVERWKITLKMHLNTIFMAFWKKSES